MTQLAALAVAGIGVLVVLDAASEPANRVAARLAPYLSRSEVRAELRGEGSTGVPRMPWHSTSNRRWLWVSAIAGCAVAVCGVAGGAALLGIVAGVAILPGGAVLPSWQARLRARIRAERIRAEVPMAADLMTIAVSAGETLWKAVDHAARHCSGPLGGELQRVIADVQSGRSFEPAMRSMADRVADDGLRRLVDAIAVGQARGTPISEALRALSTDLREERRRDLIADAGTRQVVMLVPVVVLVLPAALLVAFWPAFVSLREVVG